MHSSLERQNCRECGRMFESDELVSVNGVSVCSRCKPILLQKLTEGVSNRPGTPARRPIAIWAALLGFFVMFGGSLVRAAMRADWNNSLVYIRFATEIIMVFVPLLFIFVGRGWARWLLAGYAFSGLILIVSKLNHPSWSTAFWLKNAVVVGALIGLFLPSSTKWFRRKANARTL